MSVHWLICDFAGVLGEHQPDATKAAMVEAAGADPGPFWDAYWAERPEYDRGARSAASYWTAVADRVGSTWDAATIRELVRLDVESWLVPNPESLGVARSFAERGYSLALLSNAPHELAAAVETLDWMDGFRPMMFSCRIGAVKPSETVYRAALARLGAEPGDALFVDDREPNVRGAAAVGMRARLFTDPASMAAELPPA